MAEPLGPPLEGVRVPELAHLIAGPICGKYLGDMGADVVKVESRDAPDAGRSVSPSDSHGLTMHETAGPVAAGGPARPAPSPTRPNAALRAADGTRGAHSARPLGTVCGASRRLSILVHR